VEDTGVGLSPETLQRLFEPFFTTKRTGLGMGLSISRSILEVHQGRLQAEPREGRGARFRCTLPCV
jgi:two-component system, LuxR family, sensor kinase FixL